MILKPSIPSVSAALSMTLLVAACGGGGGDNSAPSALEAVPAQSLAASSLQLPPPSTGTLTNAQRAKAATLTANTHPECSTIKLGTFYWEVGDRQSALVSGQVGTHAPGANTKMSIASASKWLYSTYVVQKVGVRSQDVPYLNFTSGWTEMRLPLCEVSGTVGSCLIKRDGSRYDQIDATIGKFFYASGHMQQHAAALMGLSDMNNKTLAAELAATIGDFGFGYSHPQLAGGAVGSASDYAAFLRAMLSGKLAMLGALGSNKVCTNPVTCSLALSAPVPETESWNYSLGHWVEDDPVVGDGAFSSAGAFGFYPWIDHDKTWYGVLARHDASFTSGEQAGYNSARCGRKIRKSWITGTALLN